MREAGNLMPWEPGADDLFALDVAARMAGTTRRMFLLYCRWGGIEPVLLPPYGMLAFPQEAIRIARVAERLQQEYGVNRAGIRVILRLIRRMDGLVRQP